MTRHCTRVGLALLAGLLAVGTSRAETHYGRLAGIVVDFTGKPQMGATVWVMAEGGRGPAPMQARTNDRGHFIWDRLPAGLYSVRVTLAGFLPALDQHVRVSADITTVLKLELDSVFSSMARLRKQPDPPVEADEWTWLLRTSTGTRPVLRWKEGESDNAGKGKKSESSHRQSPRARLELTSGSLRPGMYAGAPLGASSAFAYDQSVGGAGRLLLAGQFRYEGATSAGLATTWLPFGSLPGGPRTSIVMQQFRLGPAGPTFRGVRTEQDGELAFSSHVTLRYGAQYLWMGFERSTAALRPRAELAVRLTKKWTATASAGARPMRTQTDAAELETALSQFDTFPAVMFRNGRPLMELAWHEELGLERRSGMRSSFAVAVFHDQARHTPVFARAILVSNEVPTEFLPFSPALDGGESSSTGTRVAYRQKFSNEFESVFVYSWAGALSLDDDQTSAVALRDALQTRYRHSLAARVSTRLPRVGTRLTSSYKWMNAAVVSRQDAYGEVLYDIDPFLSMSLRQPLPNFFGGGKLEALADVRNLLAEGYVWFNAPDGRVRLIPARRMIRGGLSFQF